MRSSPSKAVRAVFLCSTMAITGGAYAQGADTTTQLEEIVVTGSRVVTNGNDSPTPVTVISVAESEQVRPATIAEQLNERNWH